MLLTVTLNPSIDRAYMMEEFQIGNIGRAISNETTAGGKGLNVSRVLRLLGEDVVATGFLGGESGRYIRYALKWSKIADEFVEIRGETRTCISIFDKASGSTTEILEAGPVVKKTEMDNFINAFSKLAESASLIILSGSVPKDVTVDIYGHLIDIGYRCDKRTILDTSGVPLKYALPHKPFFIKPNLEELSAYCEKTLVNENDVIKELEKLHALGIQIVCASLGKDGCIAISDSGIYRVYPPRLENAQNTVGSGDSFVAGFASEMYKSNNIERSLIKACACGASNTQFASTGMISSSMVEEYEKQVKIHKLK